MHEPLLLSKAAKAVPRLFLYLTWFLHSSFIILLPSSFFLLPQRRRQFHAFLKAEYAEESLLFWDEAAHYSQHAPTMAPEVRLEKIRTIYDTYISKDADLMVNISHVHQKTIKQAIDAATASAEMEAAGLEVDGPAGSRVVGEAVLDGAQVRDTRVLLERTGPVVNHCIATHIHIEL